MKAKEDPLSKKVTLHYYYKTQDVIIIMMMMMMDEKEKHIFSLRRST